MSKANKIQELPLPVIIGVTVLALLLVAWQAFRAFGPDPDVQRGMEDNRFITQMAIKSGGDLTRLSQEERDKLQKMTKGEAETVLKLHPSSAMGRMQAGGPAGTGAAR